MSFLTELFSGGAGALVDSVGNVLDNLVTTKEEKGQLDNEMRKAENEYQLEVLKLSVEEKKMVIEDIGNARSREVEIAKSESATKLSKNTLPILSIGTIFLSFTLFYVLIFSPNLIPKDSKDIVIYILGVLSAILAQVYSYHFGSSSGSAAKDLTIKSMKN